MACGGAPILWDVVEEHLDEASFLWSQWRAARDTSVQSPVVVAARVEERLLAHLEALELLDSEGLARLEHHAGGDAGKAFSLGLVLAESPSPRLLSSAGLLDPGPAIAEALGLCRSSGADPLLDQLLHSENPARQIAGLAGFAIRQRPVERSLLETLLASEVVAVRVAALRCARILGLPTGSFVSPAVAAALESDDSAERDAALETGAILGMRRAYLAARSLCQDPSARSDTALGLLAISGEAKDLDTLAQAAETPSSRRRALNALGASGWGEAVELCLPHLESDELAAVAGEAISAITGLVLHGKLTRPELASGEPIAFEDEELDAALVFDPDGLLPRPNPDGIEAWWAKARGRFDPQQRYLSGSVFGPESVMVGLRNGPMRRRAALALELAVRSQGSFQVPTHGWVRDQLRGLQGTPLVVPSDFEAPFAELLRA